MKKLLAAIAPAIALASCGPIYYAPNSANVPLFSAKKEITGGLSAGSGGTELHGAYAISNHVLGCANYASAKPKEDGNGNGGTGNLLEIGGGYYQALNEQFTWGATAAYGFGSMENHYPAIAADEKINASFSRWSVQPYIGLRNKYYEIAGSIRLCGVSYSGISGKLTLNNTDQVAYLSSNSSQIFIEPALTLRAGYKFIFLQLQDIGSYNLGNLDFPYRDNVFTGGIYLKFQLGKKGE